MDGILLKGGCGCWGQSLLPGHEALRVTYLCLFVRFIFAVLQTKSLFLFCFVFYRELCVVGATRMQGLAVSSKRTPW